MLSGRKILFFGGLFYLAFLVASIPTGIVARQIERQTDKRILLGSEKGTLWKGSADILIVDPNGAVPRRLGSASWRFRAADLLGGKLGFDLEIADRGVMAKGVVGLGAGGVRIKDAKAEIQAGWLARFHGALATLRPGGRIVFDATDFSFTPGGFAGRAELRWLNASSALTAQPLGNYRADLEGKAQGVSFSLATEQGVLDLSGAGNWSRRGGLAFDGIARKRADAVGLDALLRIMGPAQSDGAYLIRVRG